MLCKLNLGRLYNSITQHNWSLFDYSKGESERIYEITLPLHTEHYAWRCFYDSMRVETANFIIKHFSDLTAGLF